jgi:hypothetical protein
MNHSMYGADRATHLKIVVMALLAAISVAGFGLSLHLYATDMPTETTAALKLGKPLQVGSTTLALSR